MGNRIGLPREADCQDLGGVEIIGTEVYGHPANGVMRMVLRNRQGFAYSFRFMADDKYVRAVAKDAPGPTDAQCALLGEEPPPCQIHASACSSSDHPANPGADLDPNG